MSENSDQKHATRWRKGQSGNPAGKPRGALHKATLAAQALLDGEAEALARKAIARALEGDTTAMRLRHERILPPRKERPLRLALPALNSASDATAALAAITATVAEGKIAPGGGESLTGIIAGYVRAAELSDIEARVAALEQKVSSNGK